MQYSTHLLRHLRFSVGRTLHAARLRRRMPLKKLARLSGLPETRLDQYELNKHDISLEHLLRIACILDVEISALLP